MAFENCSGNCKNFKIPFNPNKASYGEELVRCITCVIMLPKSKCNIKSKLKRAYCPCCNAQVRHKPRHWTRKNRAGIDNRKRVC